MKPPREFVRKLYEYDALGLKQREGPAHHVVKHKQKTKGLEVVFDPKGHREYLTGFRKRKQERRAQAQKQLKTKAAEARAQERAQRRQKLKSDLGLPENYGVGSSSSEDEGDAAEEQLDTRGTKRVYQGQELTTTVTTVALDSDEDAVGSSGQGSDSGDEAEEQGEGEGSDDGEQVLALPPSGRRAQAAAKKAAAAASVAGATGNSLLGPKHAPLKQGGKKPGKLAQKARLLAKQEGKRKLKRQSI